MIQVTDLHKHFGKIKAVDGVSFTINKGEVFGLLGPNGAGKTTTINMMVGIIRPDSGRVGINGDGDPTSPGVRLQIGTAPQSLALYDKLSAVENLEFFGRMYKLSGSHLKERVEFALEFAGLKHRRKDAVEKFSGGMKRRLNMAVAIIHDPPVLFFDEPTVGIDPQSRNMIFESIEHLKRQGRTIVYTTHYMEEAQRLCERVAIIDHGKILALDTVDALTSEHGGATVIEADLEKIPENVSDLPGELQGNRLRINSSDPVKDLSILTGHGIKFRQLRVDRPDLEMVFLNLTGRSLRD